MLDRLRMRQINADDLLNYGQPVQEYIYRINCMGEYYAMSIGYAVPVQLGEYQLCT